MSKSVSDERLKALIDRYDETMPIEGQSMAQELKLARVMADETDAMVRRSKIIGLNPDFWTALEAYKAFREEA